MSVSTMPRQQAAERHAASSASPARTYFFLTGEAGSELLPRVLLPFAKLGLVPYRVHASAEHGAGEEMSIELRFTDLKADRADLLASRCRAIVGVRTVMTVGG
jgi:hypothetical protein